MERFVRKDEPFLEESPDRRGSKRRRAVCMARRKGLTFYQKKKKLNSKLIKDIFEVLVGSVVAVFLAFVIIFSVGMRTSVIGDSMEPTLYNAQEILISRFAYKLSSPKRGDVIVFLPNGNQNTHLYVKRVIGLPGETVLIKDGQVYINGKVYDENGAYADITNAGLAESSITLESGEYFVLGDNRNNSEDSRFSDIGNISKKYIVGKLWFTVSPKSKIGFIK